MGLEKLAEIGVLIQTQDNRCTSDPLFVVQQRKRIYGMDPNYTDQYVFIDHANDCEEADSEEAVRLSEADHAGEDLGDWIKTGYVDTWEFVTACFTEQGCKDYIAANGHNLTEPRIYAASAYRNGEFIAVREALKGGEWPTVTHEDHMQCECLMWGSDCHFAGLHHINCPRFNPRPLHSILCCLLDGMEKWAADEDGIHPDAWEAYQNGVQLVRGVPPKVQSA